MNKKIAVPFNLKKLTGSGQFEGYGSVFGNTDSVGDIVEPGAFSVSLDNHRSKGTMPALLLHHDSRRPCGVYKTMLEDDHGLFVAGQLLVNTTDGSDAYELLQAGALNGLSIGYRTVDEEFDRQNGVTKLKEIDLWEVSLVTFPANDQARVGSVKSPRDFERFLRENGFSRNRAKNICCQGFKSSSASINHEIHRILKDSIKIFDKEY